MVKGEALLELTCSLTTHTHDSANRMGGRGDGLECNRNYVWTHWQKWRSIHRVYAMVHAAIHDALKQHRLAL